MWVNAGPLVVPCATQVDKVARDVRTEGLRRLGRMDTLPKRTGRPRLSSEKWRLTAAMLLRGQVHPHLPLPVANFKCGVVVPRVLGRAHRR